LFEEFVGVGLYRRVRLDKHSIAKLEKNGYPDCANFKYFATQSTHATAKKKEEGTNYSHSQKLSEMSEEKRTEKRKQMMGMLSKKKLIELTGAKQDPNRKKQSQETHPNCH
jgi:hypothetical protein